MKQSADVVALLEPLRGDPEALEVVMKLIAVFARRSRRRRRVIK